VSRLTWGGAALAVLVLAGCPPSKPPVTPVATVKETDLPDDPGKLVEYADAEYRKQSVEGAQNSLKAMEKAAIKGKTYDVLWRMARAYSWLADEFEDSARVEEFSQKGIAVAREAIALDPSKVEGQYYLGTTTGQFAFVKKLQAKALVPQVLASAQLAVKADERYDYAGPLRLLGSIYAQAPEPPTSVGDHEEGVKVLARAIQLADQYPQNHLLMAEAQLINRNLDQAEREYQRVINAKIPPEVSWAHRYPKWRTQAEQGLKRVNNLRRQNATDRGSPF
jgi:tetratricopeptide (TPR) repeat protein